MNRQKLLITLSVLIGIFAPTIVFGQAAQISTGGSSEWEATGFNNGRRIVRDSNGYLHAFWHSITTFSVTTPEGIHCNIYYSYTTVVANESTLSSMANANAWVTPISMTGTLHNIDNRYPSVAIDYDNFDGGWKNVNKIHVVWQAITAATLRYEVLYANIPITNPPTNPTHWNSFINLSNTSTDSLVPAITINRFSPDSSKQHIHVVWQEEDVNPDSSGGGSEDNWYSDIAYIRSVDGGVTWSGPTGGWNGNVWDNLTKSTANSQMPSIASILDQYTGYPAQSGISELGYNSSTIHVSYNEDIANTGINVFYLYSPNDGVTWIGTINVTSNTGGTDSTFDAYSNIAVDMLDNPHITFMRGNMLQNEPLRTGTDLPHRYRPGIDPSLPRSFPGPNIGMYGARINSVVYAYSSTQGGTWYWNDWSGTSDREFPTIELDRYQNVIINWQEYVSPDYEIMQVTRINQNPPSYPSLLQNYQALWNGPDTVSNDTTNDDLFPNPAPKKSSMYSSPNEPVVAGYDEIWTKINGQGSAAVNSNKAIFQDGNMTWVKLLTQISDWILYGRINR